MYFNYRYPVRLRWGSLLIKKVYVGNILVWQLPRGWMKAKNFFDFYFDNVLMGAWGNWIRHEEIVRLREAFDTFIAMASDAETDDEIRVFEEPTGFIGDSSDLYSGYGFDPSLLSILFEGVGCGIDSDTGIQMQLTDLMENSDSKTLQGNEPIAIVDDAEQDQAHGISSQGDAGIRDEHLADAFEGKGIQSSGDAGITEQSNSAGEAGAGVPVCTDNEEGFTDTFKALSADAANGSAETVFGFKDEIPANVSDNKEVSGEQTVLVSEIGTASGSESVLPSGYVEFSDEAIGQCSSGAATSAITDGALSAPEYGEVYAGLSRSLIPDAGLSDYAYGDFDSGKASPASSAAVFEVLQEPKAEGAESHPLSGSDDLLQAHDTKAEEGKSNRVLSSEILDEAHDFDMAPGAELPIGSTDISWIVADNSVEPGIENGISGTGVIPFPDVATATEGENASISANDGIGLDPGSVLEGESGESMISGAAISANVTPQMGSGRRVQLSASIAIPVSILFTPEILSAGVMGISYAIEEAEDGDLSVADEGWRYQDGSVLTIWQAYSASQSGDTLTIE